MNFRKRFLLVAAGPLLSSSLAFGQPAPTPRPTIDDPAINGQRGWISDAHVGVPILKSNEMKIVGGGTLGYRWSKLEIIGSADIHQYSSESNTALNVTSRLGAWLNGAYVTGDPGDKLRLLLLADLSYMQYDTAYEVLPDSQSVVNGQPVALNVSFKNENSGMIRASAVLGFLLAPSSRTQGRVVLGVGVQNESYAKDSYAQNTPTNGAPTTGSGNFDMQDTASLRLLARVAFRQQIVPDVVALRLVSDTNRFEMRRSGSAFKIDLSDPAAATASFTLFTLTQIESSNRLAIDIDKLGFFGLMPSVFGGVDISALSGDLGSATAIVPVFGVGISNGQL